MKPDSASIVIAIVAYVALAFVQRYAFYRRRYQRFVVILVVVAILAANLAPLLSVPGLDFATATAIVPLGGLAYALVRAFANLPARRAWLADARTNPMVLAAPFAGRWVVAAGGPDPGVNHHLVASDQRFAYDFLRKDAASFGSPILAPVSGRVVAASDGKSDHRPSSLRIIEDPEPLGNHVAIETSRGVVFLCHLRNGSVRVRAGDDVAAGAEIGRCGNSGRTTRPHLHVHAQDLPAYAFNRARGIPIAFSRGEGPIVLRAGMTANS